MKKIHLIPLLFSLLSAESLEEVLKQTKIEGFVYGQLTSMFGSDASGSALQTRVWIDVETGDYSGFSLGTRVFVDNGTGGPDGGTFLQNSGNPSKILSIDLMSLYGKYVFQSTKTTITAGKMNIVAPFGDYAWDFGYGASIENADIDGITFSLQGYGAWGLDNWNDIHNDPNAEKGESMNSSYPLFIGGVSGENLSGVGFDLWVAHAIKTIDYLVFADLNYSIADFTLQTQVATAQVDTSNIYFDKGTLSAKLRGLYNVQASFKKHGVELLAGYTGSFGDGYGALLNYCGGFNMGGNIWWDVGGGNGYALNGVGGYKQNNQKTDISVAYGQISYFGFEKLFMGLSYAYVGGNNQYRLMKKGYSNHLNSPLLLGGSLNAKLHEVSLVLNYNFTEKLSLFGLIGSTFGDLEIGKAQAKLTYSF